jgi:alanine racemase
LPVHLKLDTGMNRLGASKGAWAHLCEMLSACQHLTLEGVSTHFASAEVLDAEDAMRQMKSFEEGLGGPAKPTGCGRRSFTWEIRLP